MNRPVPISHDRRSAHPRPPTLRHETDSSSASDFDEHSTFSPSFTSINSRSHSSSSHSSGSNHDRLTGRPISLPLPTLEPSLGYPQQQQLLSPGEYLNPMSIAAALARTAADLPPQSSAQAASGAAAGNKTGIGMGTNNGSGHGQHQSSTGGVGGSGSSISGHHRSHSAGSHRRDGDQRTPPPMSDEETRGIVEQLRAMGQSLHEASRAQRRLVDETMHKWNTGSDNGK
ncbi:hypothetical protein Micbo1qcDRAFT_207710 [Microdochium bolleyi]|uniref:Uncharacterized protein n=1 Tax=Microdochium bolleyi TaxID=196109 RepID=A0A136ISR1_9PEZI|nr:hypothetical protein Micbo1qcDRAFT_207710 [Microdochium bolleyi]